MRAIRRRPLVAGLLGAVAAPAVARAQAQEIRLGALFPFSGAMALLGDESFRGLELAVEERNAAGGAAGRPLRLIRGDAGDQAQATSEVRRLMAAERAAVVFGTAASPLSVAATQASELQGVPYFELGAIADAITERGFRSVFRTGPRASGYGTVTATAIENALAPALGVPPRALRIAILHEDSMDGQAIAQAQETELRSRGLQLVERIAAATRPADLAAALQRLRAANADILLHTAIQSDMAPFFRTMDEAGWRPRLLVGAGAAYALADTARAIGPAFEGVLSVEVTPLAVGDRFAPGARAFHEAYKRRHGADPRSGHSLTNYAGALVALDAIHRAGGTDRERLRAAVLATDIADGGTAAGWGARFDEKGQNMRALPILSQWQEGRIAAVFPALAAVAPLRARMGAG